MQCYGLQVTISSNATGPRGERDYFWNLIRSLFSGNTPCSFMLSVLDIDDIIILNQDDLKNWPIDLKMLTSDVGPLLISQPGNPDCSRHASIEPDTIFLKIFPYVFQRTSNGE